MIMKRFIKKLFAPRNVNVRRTNRRVRLMVEALEDRQLMSFGNVFSVPADTLAIPLTVPTQAISVPSHSPIGTPPAGPAPVSPVGPAFDVNGQAPLGEDMGTQAVARAANGNFAEVWSSQAANQGGIFFRLFQADGTPVTDALQIEGTDQNDSQASIAMDANGEFAIAWASSGQILAQRFDAAGNYVGHFALVSGASPLYNFAPAIALNDNGWLTVAFSQQNDPAITGTGTAADTFLNLWCQSAPDQQGIMYNAGDNRAFRASIALNDNNQGVIAYVADWRDIVHNGKQIILEEFTPQSGLQWGRLITSIPGRDYDPLFSDPSVAINSAGIIVVAYSADYYMDPGQKGPLVMRNTLVQRYTADATWLSTQDVSAYTPSDPYYAWEYHPSVAEDNAGDFVVATTQELFTRTDGTEVSQSVVVRVFNGAGSPLTGSLEVSSTADDPVNHTQNMPAVAMDGSGNFVVTFLDQTNTGIRLNGSLFNWSTGVN
jgi:hypothetical protein